MARLASPITSIEPIKLYDLQFGIEDGQAATILGAGNSGNGNSGQQSGTGGTRRAAQTYIHANADAWGWGSHRLLTWFRSPSGGAANLEGGSTNGDSGGGVLLNVNGEHAIAGVMQLVWWGGSTGSTTGQYNSGGVYVRSAPINDWILQHATDAVLISDEPDPTDFRWDTGSSGSWHVATNWDPNGIPDGNNHTVEFTGAIAAISNISLNTTTTVREVTLDGASEYRLNGTGMLRLDADTGIAQMNVQGGSHRWTASIQSLANTSIDVMQGGFLELDGPISFTGRTIVKSGSGTLSIDGPAAAGTGTMQLAAGTLSGDGVVNGDLVGTNGVVAPGSDVGDLRIRGDFTLGASAELQIDIAGLSTNQFDRLAVDGTANLSGTLEVDLENAFVPLRRPTIPDPDSRTGSGQRSFPHWFRRKPL